MSNTATIQPRYIPKTLPTMPAGQWAVWDTTINNWLIYPGSPPVPTNTWEVINQRCRELNRRS
jgi:hypothetical protein